MIYKKLKPLFIKSIFDEKKILDFIDLYKQRAISLKDITKSLSDLINYNKNFEDNDKKKLEEFSIYKNLFTEKLINLKKWDDSNIELFFKDFIDLHNISFKSIAQPVRLLISGNVDGPSVYKIMRILGKTECLKRIIQNL